MLRAWKLVKNYLWTIHLSVEIAAAIFFSKANKDNDSISVALPVVWSIDVLMLFHYIDELSSKLLHVQHLLVHNNSLPNNLLAEDLVAGIKGRLISKTGTREHILKWSR